ncbi:sensor histidine kinase [Bifidobacterium apri]|nr:histidine kinase [Bifidobacterium apri]
MTRMTSWAKHHVLAVDTTVTVLVAVLFLFASVSTGSTPGVLFYCPPPVRALWQIAVLVPAATRRWRPEPSAWAITAIATCQLIIGPVLVPADLFALTVLYAVIVYGNPKRSRLFACLALALGILASLALAMSSSVGPVFGDPGSAQSVILCQGTDPHQCAQEFLSVLAGALMLIILSVITVIFLAYWQRARNVTITMLQERNAALQAGEEERRRIAALAERARIARDMHDVVAHTLSIIIVQSDGGRYAGASNPQIAKDTMHTIEYESHRAMQDMQHLLGVFGQPDHADYRHVRALIDEARHWDAEMDIMYQQAGQPHPAWLSETASTAMYRMVQEALTNVRKYGGPDVHVNIEETWSGTGLTVRVTDDGRGASAAADGHKPGFGLQGMRERITMAGGSVQAGPRLSGGFEVMASVPYRDTDHRIDTQPAYPANPPATDTSASISHRAQISHPAQATASRPPAPTTDIQYSDTVAPATPPAYDSTDENGAMPRRRDTKHPLSLSMRPVRIMNGLLHRCFGSARPAPTASAVDTNAVERMSVWWERHYLAADILSGALWFVLFAMIGSSNDLTFVINGREADTGNPIVVWIVTALVITPWMFRRRFPRASAAFAFVFAVLQLLVMPSILFVNIITLAVLSAVILYGDNRATRYAIAAACVATCLCAMNVLSETLGYDSLLTMLAHLPQLRRPDDSAVVATASSFIAVALMCLIAVISAVWKRTSGNDALVLQAREQAINEEAHRQQVLAANVERDRISANIQSEVTQTLQSVITRTDAGLAMFEQAEREGSEPDADAVRDAFKQIGEQGREALARMRELLGVLRKTGFSDENHDRSEDIAPLAPVTPGAVSDALSAAETAASGTTAATAESAG